MVLRLQRFRCRMTNRKIQRHLGEHVVFIVPVAQVHEMAGKMVVGVLYTVLLVLYTIVKICHGQQFSYFRCNNNTKTLQYVYFSDPITPVYDIFSQSRQSTCSFRAGVVTGQGSDSDPYILEIDLSRGLQGQNPDCGVTQAADNSMRLDMIVQSSCAGLSSTDLRSSSSCRMVIPSSPQQISGSASYFCQPPSTIVFRFSRPAPDTTAPADVYALGRRDTCSRSAGAGTGQGLSSDPFVIRINTTDTNCGVQNQGGGVFNVTMYVQQLPSLITALDNSYLLTCNFTTSDSQTLETVVIPAVSNPPTNTARPMEPTSSLSVVSQSGSQVVTALAVGDQIRLVAQLLDGEPPTESVSQSMTSAALSTNTQESLRKLRIDPQPWQAASGMRLTSCEARPGRGLQPVIQVLGADGCSTSPVLVPPFIGQYPVGRLAMTNVFRAFKFDQSDTVYFSCKASFCYDSDLTCLGSHCQLKARRKRQATPPGQETLVISIRVLDGANSTIYKGTESITSTPETASSLYNTESTAQPSLAWPVSALVLVSCLSALVVLCSVLTLWVTCRRGSTHKPDQQ